MKKYLAFLAVIMILLAAFALSGCGNPDSAAVYEIDSVEQNDLGQTKEKIAKFEIVLNEDGTYKVNFRAKGMPITVSEKGNYKIEGGKLTLDKTGGNDLIHEILEYNARAGTIKASCKDRDGGGTYNVIFKKTNKIDYSETAGTYTLKTIDANSLNLTASDFEKFEIVIDEDGGYAVNYKKGTDAKTEEGVITKNGEKINLSKESSASAGLANLSLNGGSIKADFYFDSVKLSLTFEKGYTPPGMGIDVTPYAGTYNGDGIIAIMPELSITLNADKTYEVRIVTTAMGGKTMTESGTYTITEALVFVPVRTGGDTLIESVISLTETTLTVTITMGGQVALTKV